MYRKVVEGVGRDKKVGGHLRMRGELWRSSGGCCSVDGLKWKELRLLWSLLVDWFNPRRNKAAGKSVLTGSVVMVCLNLPPSLRYKAENLFLVAVMPKEPSVEEVGIYMEPLVEMLNKLWKNGTKFI